MRFSMVGGAGYALSAWPVKSSCAIGRGGAGWVPPGGYAQYLLVPAVRHLVRLTTLDPVAAAPLTDAALTPYRAVKKVVPRLGAGTTAVLIGVGGLGQYGLQLVRLLTPARVVVVDISSDKRAAALALGADVVLTPLVQIPSLKFWRPPTGTGPRRFSMWWALMRPWPWVHKFWEGRGRWWLWVWEVGACDSLSPDLPVRR